jgi:hypothetical protein
MTVPPLLALVMVRLAVEDALERRSPLIPFKIRAPLALDRLLIEKLDTRPDPTVTAPIY